MNIRKVALALSIFALGLFAAGSVTHAQIGGKPSVVREITKIENDTVKADLANDKAFFERILANEETKTLSQALLRIWQMSSISFSAASQHGWTVGWLSTNYREILMPVLQVIAVIALLLWTTSRSTPPNTAPHGDGRESSHVDHASSAPARGRER